MAELINEKDSLNTGREKINQSIQHAENAKITSENAENIANQSLANSESTQEQLNTIVIEGDSSVEAAQARVNADNTETYATLKERLDTEYTEVTSQLAERPTKDEVNALLGNIADGTPLFAENVAGMTDTTRLYVNTSDGMIYVYNGSEFVSTGIQYQSTGIADGSVTKSKTDFVNISSNLFNHKTILTRTVIDNDGNVTVNGAYVTSDFINIEPSTVYSFMGFNYIVYYDVNKQFIGRSLLTYDGSTETMLSNAVYIRVMYQINTAYKRQINKGNNLLTYEPFYIAIDNEILNKDANIKLQGNLFNDIATIPKMNIDNNDGTLTSSANHDVSDFIKVNPNTFYTSNFAIKYAMYDANMNWLCNSTPLTTNPDITQTIGTCYYIRVVYSNLTNSLKQLNEGTVLEPYDKNTKKLNSNLFSERYTINGMNISSSTGYLEDSGNHVSSGFIKIEPLATYTCNFAIKFIFYDKNRVVTGAINSIPAGGEFTFQSPSNAHYVRIVYSSLNMKSDKYFGVGDVIVPYHSINSETLKSRDKYVIDGVLDGVYAAPIVPDKLDMSTMLSSEILNLYDALVAAYPDYVTKTSLGVNSLGAGIYKYDFKPTEVGDIVYSVKKPKMILVAGVHGSEKAGVYNLYQAMKNICENWETDALLETLRWNVHFIVIPVVNRYGYDNNQRKNENGVDIARNFPTNWRFESDTTSSTYGGTEPLTELEAQYIDNVLKDNQDAIYFCSHHNFSTQANDEHFIWNASATQLQINLSKQLISKMSRKWKKDYSWLPQDATTYFGYADNQSPFGSEGKHAVSYGIQASTFEVGEQFFLETSHAPFNSMALTLGVETFVNWLVINLKHNVYFYNSL